MGKKVTIRRECPNCGKVQLKDYDEQKYDSWKAGELIGKVFPELHPFDREYLITGYCYDCCEKIFNSPAPGHDWGEIIAECPVCGAPIYGKDGEICPNCKCHWQEEMEDE